VSNLISGNNLFGNCPRCGAVSNQVKTFVDYPDDPEPAVALICDICKAMINVSPEGANYSDLLKRIQPRTTKERTGPSSPDEVERAASALKYHYSPKELASRIPPSHQEMLALREKLLNEARDNGSLKCMVCGKVPPGSFKCHFAVTAGKNYYFFTCNSALCYNSVMGKLSRPERGNVGVGLQTGEKMFDQRKKRRSPPAET
jgi:hypothetical protein